MKHPVTGRPSPRARPGRAPSSDGPDRDTGSVDELRENRDRYRAISEAVADWAYSMDVDPEGMAELTWTNLDIARVTGYGPGDPESRNGWLGLVHPDDLVTFRRHVGALLAGRNHVAEYRIVSRSGETRWIRDYARPLGGTTHGTMQVVGGVRDITARRQAELDRARLISELEATNDELERMAISVSRELEAALTALSADPGRGDAGPDREDATLSHLHDVVDSLRELAEIGHLPETLETVDLRELATQAVDLCRDAIHEGGVEVMVGDLPEVFGDRIRLLQLLRILVENSVRYMGDQAEPRLEIGAEPGRGRHVVFVRDNGVGIDPADLERVFDVFRRLDPRSSGTGVGLALARRIAEMHGGRIRAESEGRGTGSTFYVELPA